MGDRPEHRANTERSIPARDIDPAGKARGVDDHRVSPLSTGSDHQPTDGLDAGVDDESLASPSQGVQVESTPDPDREPPPAG
jgi:hypothetical protein